MDFDADVTRYTLTDVTAYRCPRCKLQITATFHGCPAEHEPFLICGRCEATRGRKVVMVPVMPEEE